MSTHNYRPTTGIRWSSIARTSLALGIVASTVAAGTIVPHTALADTGALSEATLDHPHLGRLTPGDVAKLDIGTNKDSVRVEKITEDPDPVQVTPGDLEIPTGYRITAGLPATMYAYDPDSENKAPIEGVRVTLKGDQIYVEAQSGTAFPTRPYAQTQIAHLFIAGADGIPADPAPEITIDAPGAQRVAHAQKGRGDSYVLKADAENTATLTIRDFTFHPDSTGVTVQVVDPDTEESLPGITANVTDEEVSVVAVPGLKPTAAELKFFAPSGAPLLIRWPGDKVAVEFSLRVDVQGADQKQSQKFAPQDTQATIRVGGSATTPPPVLKDEAKKAVKEFTLGHSVPGVEARVDKVTGAVTLQLPADYAHTKPAQLAVPVTAVFQDNSQATFNAVFTVQRYNQFLTPVSPIGIMKPGEQLEFKDLKFRNGTKIVPAPQGTTFDGDPTVVIPATPGIRAGDLVSADYRITYPDGSTAHGRAFARAAAQGDVKAEATAGETAKVPGLKIADSSGTFTYALGAKAPREAHIDSRTGEVTLRTPANIKKATQYSIPVVVKFAAGTRDGYGYGPTEITYNVVVAVKPRPVAPPKVNPTTTPTTTPKPTTTAPAPSPTPSTTKPTKPTKPTVAPSKPNQPSATATHKKPVPPVTSTTKPAEPAPKPSATAKPSASAPAPSSPTTTQKNPAEPTPTPSPSPTPQPKPGKDTFDVGLALGIGMPLIAGLPLLIGLLTKAHAAPSPAALPPLNGILGQIMRAIQKAISDAQNMLNVKFR